MVGPGSTSSRRKSTRARFAAASPAGFSIALVVGLIGCQAGGPNEVRRARADAEVRADRRGEESLDREVRAAEFERFDREARMERLRVELDRTRLREAELSGQLQSALGTLQALEQDLTAANRRREVVEAELAEVRALEAERTGLDERVETLRSEVSARRDRIAELQSRLDASASGWNARKEALAVRAAEMVRGLQVLEMLEGRFLPPPPEAGADAPEGAKSDAEPEGGAGPGEAEKKQP